MLLPMEAHFPHWIKNEKSYCDFYLEIQIFFLIIALYKLTIITFFSELCYISSQLQVKKS